MQSKMARMISLFISFSFYHSCYLLACDHYLSCMLLKANSRIRQHLLRLPLYKEIQRKYFPESLVFSHTTLCPLMVSGKSLVHTKNRLLQIRQVPALTIQNPAFSSAHRTSTNRVHKISPQHALCFRDKYMSPVFDTHPSSSN